MDECIRGIRKRDRERGEEESEIRKSLLLFISIPSAGEKNVLETLKNSSI